MLKIILVIFTVFYSALLNAAGKEVVTPTFVGCFPSGTCYIGVSQQITQSTCQNKGQIRFDISLPGSDSQYAAALAAFMAGNTVLGDTQ